MYRFITSKRYVNLLFMLGKEKNIQKLSREPTIHMTVSHLSNVTAQWKKEGLIEKEISGRETEITLTKRGERLIEILREYDELAKDQWKPGAENEGES